MNAGTTLHSTMGIISSFMCWPPYPFSVRYSTYTFSAKYHRIIYLVPQRPWTTFRYPTAHNNPIHPQLLRLSLHSQYTPPITPVYNEIYPINFTNKADPHSIPPNFLSFCLVTGTMHFIAEIGVMVYSTVFCLYYTCKIKNPLKCTPLPI